MKTDESVRKRMKTYENGRKRKKTDGYINMKTDENV